MSDALSALESVGRLAWQASWHGAVLALLVLVCLRLRIVRRALSPGWRSALWLLVCARLALPLAPALPTSVHNLYRNPAESATGTLPAPASIDEPPRTPIGLAAERPPETGEHRFLNQPAPASTTISAAGSTNWTIGSLLVRIAPVGWLAGLMVVGLRYALGVWRLQGVVDSCDDVRDDGVLYLAEECRRACGLPRLPILKRVPGTFGPTVAGFLHPTLLLSDATLRMDWHSLRFILLHEMRHIRTGDCLIAWLLRGLTVLHWFNPFCWLAGRAWQAERELACDAWVLRHADADERRHYGQTLLEVVEHTSLTDAALFATGMASRPGLLERRIREMKRPIGRSGWQHAAAIVTLVALVLVGFSDARKSQPVAAAPAVQSSASTPPASKPMADKTPRKKNKGKPKKIWIVFAKHAILVRETLTQNADLSEFRIVTWDELVQLLRDASRAGRFIPELYPTVDNLDQFSVRAPQLLQIAKELKAASTLCGGMQYNSSMRYNAIRTPADLKPDLTRRREGLVRLANGQPAVGATVVLVTSGKYDCSIYINNRDIRDPLDEIWVKTAELGRYHFFPTADKFAVAALHPTGFGLATSEQIAKGQPITLAPWAQVELKGDSETGLSATRTGEGPNPVRINLQAFGHTGHTIPMPAGRVWIQRLTGNKVSGDTLVVVGPGETKAVTIEPPAPAQPAKSEKDAAKPH